MPHPDSTPSRRFPCGILRATARAALGIGLAVATAAAPSPGEEQVQPPPRAGSLRAADLVRLAKRFAQFSEDLPSAKQLGVEKILAYEENPHFVYVRGSGPVGHRRIVFCKPATFVIYDVPATADGSWRLACRNAPEVTERGFSVAEGDAVLTGRALLPGSDFEVAPADGAHVIRAVWRNAAAIARFVHVVHVGGKDAAAPEADFVEKDGTARVELTAGDRRFRLALPAEAEKPGAIAVSQSGEDVLAERVLPAGILPHGPDGVRLLERWDGPYRRSRGPGWDVGRPASELKQAIEHGVIRPGRALVLGCGAGTNAVYLASRGFDVTGIDIAPTALALAEQRARKAKVRVRWLLADVLAIPEIGPFDFIFDRGCYHHVRRYDAAGFVETVSRLSREGTLFLLLAGNANEPRKYGPPRVDEAELVNDFSKTWDFVWLKEIRFDSRDPEATSRPWAWSALVRRKAEKN